MFHQAPTQPTTPVIPITPLIPFGPNGLNSFSDQMILKSSDCGIEFAVWVNCSSWQTTIGMSMGLGDRQNRFYQGRMPN